MKTKELIRQLQAEDPSGELECTIGGEDVAFVAREPGYWDGPYEVLLREQDGPNRGDVIGVRVTDQGDKVRLHVSGLEAELFENPDLLVELDFRGGGGYREARQRSRIEQLRRRAEELERSLDCEAFVEWAVDRWDVAKEEAEAFYAGAGLSWRDKLPPEAEELWAAYEEGREPLPFIARRRFMWAHRVRRADSGLALLDSEGDVVYESGAPLGEAATSEQPVEERRYFVGTRPPGPMRRLGRWARRLFTRKPS